MPGSARFGVVVREEDRRANRDQAEDANAQNTRGSQGCAKHELPRPNFCLDHRFVRPNYAQLPVAFPYLKPLDPTGYSRRIAVQAAILAKRL